MLRKLVIFVVIAAVLGLGVFWVVTIPAIVPASALAPHTPNLDNGKTMFFAGGCASCHATPDQDDKTRLGGGLGLKSPFGTFYAPNISPDPNDGIGKWSEANFVTAMMKGTSPDGEHLFPGVPLYVLSAHALDDVRDLFALSEDAAGRAGQGARPRRAVSVQYPPHARRLEVPVPRRQAVPARRAENRRQWNRGAYLVNGPGHCAECHSPRNLLGGIIASQRFAGGPNPEGEGWVPNITQKGLGEYSRQGHRLCAGDRQRRRTATGRRSDGRRRPQHRAAPRGGPRRDGDLHQVVAAGRRAEAAGEEIATACTVPVGRASGSMTARRA